MLNVGILFADFGPYHVARIQALNRALTNMGIKLVAFRFTKSSPIYGWIPLSPTGIPVVTLMNATPSSRLEALYLATHFYRQLHKHRINAMLLPSYSPLPNLLCFLMAKAAGCRTVLMTDSWQITDNAPRVAKIIKHILVRLFDSALVAGSLQQDYVVAYGMPREKVFVGYDVVDVAHYSERSDTFRRARSGTQPMGTGSAGLALLAQDEITLMNSLPKRYFLNLGRFVIKKNLSSLLNAYAKFIRLELEINSMKKIYPPVSESSVSNTDRNGIPALVLVGEGPLRESLERQAYQLGLAVRDGVADQIPSNGAEVVFYPFQQSHLTPLFYACSDVFILPSSYEEWGLVINESMACGTPVLVSNRVGSHMDLVKPGFNGFVFDPFDFDELSELLKVLYYNQKLRSNLGMNGRELIQAWTPERFAQSGLSALNTAFANGS